MPIKHKCHCGHEDKKEQKLWDRIWEVDREIDRLIKERRKLAKESKDGCCQDGTPLADLPEEVSHYIMGLED